MTCATASSIRATARVAIVGTFALGLLDGCAGETLTTSATFHTIKRLVPEAVAPTLRSYADYGAVWSRVVTP